MTDDRIIGAAREGIGHVQDGFGGLTGDARTQAQGKINEAKGAVQKSVGYAKDVAAEGFAQARDGAVDAYDQVDRFLRERPIVGVGIGLALGALIGILISETRNRD